MTKYFISDTYNAKSFLFLYVFVTLVAEVERSKAPEWVIKTLRDCSPKLLLDLLTPAYYEESREPGFGRFFDNSRSKSGRQSIENRLDFIKKVTKPWNCYNLGNDCIRIL